MVRRSQQTRRLRCFLSIFRIPNMTCGGCAKTVTRILHGVDPQARVETDPPRREARVESTLDKHAFLEALSEAGYPEGR
ncbi:copper chaperone [Pseudomonas aeruginosa]|uniref:heavy-metal-associated domain-containing protein n=1 Tax=Pseudomonas aeruginosa TaxID=287 RepID=UPI0009973A0D|nr:heavy-metal-associated domain-containing protein [Pseudomonas aeruginosa]KAB0751790.1 heavy-metal-associated domain-containing protein [Pseudomonas aeruginosa]MBG4347958.1 heavy-metal-associated domain-containing protein [Pseudomonas aeruginosa]MBG4907874.1 heavy-metal-associated domain-containing protein [Pseudomonas aeruginosa]MBG6417808.1 heavy-metal-associated domain-containing protein [Pseudomonas aeruginosa]MBG7207427.1 heavy-metal-associated domain-containing protein [Pseudomonas aer